MNITLIIKIPMILTAIWFACVLPAQAGPFEEAVAAYEEKDYEKAYPLLTPLAEAGDENAQYYLGSMYEYGWGVKWSDKQALYWYLKSAKAGHAEAQNTVANLYYLGASGVKQNKKTAFKWFMKAAKNGHADAQFDLAVNYRWGNGTKKNLEKALEWFGRAASQNHDRSRVEIGLMYEEGYNGFPEYTEAVQYYSLAAKNGEPSGMYEYARVQEKGIGVVKDTIGAQYWYQQAHDAGVEKAKTGLDRVNALLAEDYNREQKSNQDAQKQRLAAANIENDIAAKALAAGPIENGWIAYNAGEYERAFPILLAHADNGDVQAQTRVGVMYRDGNGVEQNDNAAGKWFEKAETGGSGEAYYHHAMLRSWGRYYGGTLLPDQLMEKSYYLGYQPAIDRIKRTQAEKDRIAGLQQEKLQRAAEEAETDLERRIREKKEYDDSIDDIQLGRCRNPKYYTVQGERRVSCD